MSFYTLATYAVFLEINRKTLTVTSRAMHGGYESIIDSLLEYTYR